MFKYINSSNNYRLSIINWGIYSLIISYFIKKKTHKGVERYVIGIIYNNKDFKLVGKFAPLIPYSSLWDFLDFVFGKWVSFLEKSLL